MRQAGTITNMTVIQDRFYDLAHFVATLISFEGERRRICPDGISWKKPGG